MIKGWTFNFEHSMQLRGRPFAHLACHGDVLKKFHHSCLAVHPGGTKMYQDLRRQYWWKRMKRSVVEWSLPTIIATKLAYRWHRLRPSMADRVDLLCVGPRLVSHPSWVLI